MKADAQANLNKWLSTLPSRLLLTINIANSPFNEYGIKQTGMWVTMSLLVRSIAGKTTPLDTILLGPVDPQVYMPKTAEIQSVQIEIPKQLTAEEISKVQFPSDGLNIVDKLGNVVPITLQESKPVAAAPAPQPTGGVPAPVCYVDDETDVTSTKVVPSTTNFVFSGQGAFTSKTLSYICIGYK